MVGRSCEPERRDRTHPHGGACAFERLIADLGDVEDDLAEVIEVKKVGRRFFAEAVALAAWSVDLESHVRAPVDAAQTATTSRTSSLSMLRVMLLGSRTSSPVRNDSMWFARAAMTAWPSMRARP